MFGPFPLGPVEFATAAAIMALAAYLVSSYVTRAERSEPIPVSPFDLPYPEFPEPEEED